RNRAHQVGHEAADAGACSAAVRAAPHHDLVEADVADRLGRLVGEVLDLLEHEETVRLVCAAACGDDTLETFGLLRQLLVLTARCRFEPREDCGGLALCLESPALGKRLGLDDATCLLRLCGRFE